jgi:DNA-binding CsgD family transcriptional regulator
VTGPARMTLGDDMGETDISTLKGSKDPRPNFDRTMLRRAPHQERRGPGPADLNAALVGAELEELTREDLFVLAPVPSALDRLVPPDVFSRLLERRIEVRILYTAQPEPGPELFSTFIRTGVALQTSLDLRYFVVIRDRAVVYLPHQDPSHPLADRLTRVRSVVMAGSMATAFNEIWSTSARRARVALADEVAAGNQEILQVLSDGLTDDRAAARLHMSKRTFARRVAIMMERLEASSRFQAGVRAARRGWV